MKIYNSIAEVKEWITSNALINADCIEAMKHIPDNSIDMILTDPPYGTTALKWDGIIPFKPMWGELNRIIKSNGCIALFGSEPFITSLKFYNIQNYKYDWYWIKNKKTGFTHSKNRPMKQTEIIAIFSHGVINHKSLSGDKRMEYYPQGIIRIDKIKKPRKSFDNVLLDKSMTGKSYITEFTNYPTELLHFSKDANNIHPTQKPIKLLEYLIKTYTLENEIVLDFTMGSGSTGVACKNLNRKFIGIELDKHYFEMAQKRINNEYTKPVEKQIKILNQNIEIKELDMFD